MQFGVVEHAQIVDAVGFGLRLVFLETRDFAFVAGDDHLADALMFDVVFCAILVKRFAARHAQFRLHRTGSVINASVNDFRVARTGVGAEGIFSFENDDFAPVAGKLARYGETHHASADYGAIQSFHDELYRCEARDFTVPCRVMARLAYTWLMDMCDIWDSRFAERSPMFEPLRPLALALAGDTWPAPERLNELALELGVVSGGGQPLRFVNVTGKDAPKAADYELRIHDEGIVPMRVANWHDFFNAVVWLTFPHIKSALNRGHARELRSNLASTRNRRRDALTLFDESGVLVFSCSREVLDGLRAFAWGRVLRDARNTFQTTTRCLIVVPCCTTAAGVSASKPCAINFAQI